MIRRDSLRAERDFYSPMTGNTGTEIRYAAAQSPVSGKYGSEVKKRLADIGSGSGRTAQLIKAKKAAMNKTADPFSQIQEIKEKGSQDNNDIAAQIEGAVGSAQSAVKNAADAFDREYGALSDQYQKDRQTTSDQIKGVSSSFDKQYGVLQGDIKSVKDQVSTVGTQVSTVGTQLDKVKADLNKPPQVTTKPENTPAKAVEVATKAKEEAADDPFRTRLVIHKEKKGRKAFMGNSTFKSPRRVANRNKAKAMAKARKAKKTSSPSRSGTSGGRGFGSKSSARGARGSTSSRSRGGVSRGSRSGSPSRGGARGGAKGGSAGRGASKKGGTRRGSRKSNRGRRGRRGGRRCDIRCKVNISLLTNMNLLRDDLADVAYFVRELKEV